MSLSASAVHLAVAGAIAASAIGGAILLRPTTAPESGFPTLGVHDTEDALGLVPHFEGIRQQDRRQQATGRAFAERIRRCARAARAWPLAALWTHLHRHPCPNRGDTFLILKRP